MFAFEVTYTEDASAKAERLVYLNAILTERAVHTLLPPAFWALVLAGSYYMPAPTWFHSFATVLLVASSIGPPIFLFARGPVGRAMGRKYPTRRVTIDDAGIRVSAAEEQLWSVTWPTVRGLRERSGFVIFSLGKFVGFAIPKTALPDGALEFARHATKNAA